MSNIVPILSVIIPALVADLELRRCVDSVMLACGTSDVRCEIILVMPLSQIDLAKVHLVGEGVRKFVPETGRGIYRAMNDGIRESRGRYLFFLGKDDIMLRDFGKMLDQLDQHGGSAAFCDVYWGRGGLYSGRPSKWRVLIRNFCHQGIVYSRKVMDDHGPYVRRFRVQADHFLNIRLLWDANYAGSIRYFPGGRVWYAAEGYSSVTQDKLFWRLYPAILRKFVGRWPAVLITFSRCLRGKRA
jgi:glycosyltransferase involved in cell wall biosynthesis